MSFCDGPNIEEGTVPKKRERKRPISTGRNAGTRFRSSPDPGQCQFKEIDWVWNSADKVSVPAQESYRLCGYTSRMMWDTHGYIQNWYNPCVNEKMDTSHHQGLNAIYDEDSLLIDFKTTTPSALVSIRSTCPFPDSAFLDELTLKTMDHFQEVAPSNVSLINFIIELIEVVEGNMKIVKRFSVLWERCLHLYLKKLEELIKLGVKPIAAKWLAWNFAWKPAIADLKAMVCSFQEAQKRIAWLKSRNHTVTFLDHRRAHCWVPDDLGQWKDGELLFNVLAGDPPELWNGAYKYRVRYYAYKIDYTARAKVLYDIPDGLLEGFEGAGTMWAAINGLYNPIGIVWEAIPFSWLIDYFLSYRARLFQRLDFLNPYKDGVTVLETGHSFKIQAFGEVELYNSSTGRSIAGLGDFEYNLYSRSNGLPVADEVTLFRVPGDLYHLSILGALGIGFTGPRRR